MTSKHKLLGYIFIVIFISIGFIGIGFGPTADKAPEQPNWGRFLLGAVGVALTIGITSQEKSEF